LRQGLELLHSAIGQSIAHGDIKGDNIMLRDGQPVLIDFGHSHAIAHQDNQRMDDFLREPPPVARRAKQRSRSRSGSPVKRMAF